MVTLFWDLEIILPSLVKSSLLGKKSVVEKASADKQSPATAVVEGEAVVVTVVLVTATVVLVTATVVLVTATVVSAAVVVVSTAAVVVSIAVVVSAAKDSVVIAPVVAATTVVVAAIAELSCAKTTHIETHKIAIIRYTDFMTNK